MAALMLVCSISTVRAGTLVTINTNMGEIKVDLFNEVTVETVNNFVNLITAGRYTNTIFHRSTTADFMIQGGGFTTNYQAIPNNGMINLDYQIKNRRGTIAMARTNAPNTASSQFFINTVDNSTGLGPGGWSADGYTVFGWVVSGMDVVDAIEDLPIYNFAGRTGNNAMGELPLRNYTQADYLANVPITDANKVVVNGISIAQQHPSYQNPILATDTNNDGNLNSQDALLIINDLLLAGTAHNASADYITDTYKYFDANGDGRVNSKDLLMVFNAILTQNNAAAMAAQPMAMPMAVPEPGTWAMLLTGLSALGVAGWRRRRRAAK